MDRRSALKALASLPAIDAIKVANVTPNDVLVVECNAPITEQMAARIKATVQQVFGEQQKCLVFGSEMRLKVIKGQG